eukprot:TRINITY_DN10365_c0_g1_i3.p1 TRINITY_DN10365_c0_g1~~TRINITY_DN10365_c0_g1_i3.p1  ORF type:complete len:641 (+),score=84.75 TRINITY_DN10365_c0_g1_i3:113-2035(+)
MQQLTSTKNFRSCSHKHAFVILRQSKTRSLVNMGRQRCGIQVQARKDVIAKAAAVEVEKVDNAFMSSIQMYKEKFRLQTQVLDVAQDTICIRSLDWDRDRFDIEFGLQEGTTYNSYLIFGEKTCLVDASHEKFRSLYMETLHRELEAHGRSQIDYVFVSHTEPDHSGLIPDILDEHPSAVVVGSKVCIQFLKNLTHRPFIERIVKGNDKIDLGWGHEMEFVMAPNLHWPDTMFSFDHGTDVMYTCDAFGMHLCAQDPFDTDLQNVLPHYRFYYDCLMKPNSRSVLTALRKVKNLTYKTIATGHGPILRYNMEELVGKYQEWSAKMGKAPASVAVLYSSEYGFGDRLSQTIAKGITKAGVATEMLDLLSIDHSELREAIGKNAGVVVMCPPASSKEAQESLAVVFSTLGSKKKVMLAESFGGEDEPMDTLISNCISVGVEPFGEQLRVKNAPTESTYQRFEEAGTDLAQVLTKKETVERQRGMDKEICKAIAKISSGLYVVTATRNNASSAMIASWVAQASFEPLGLTIAVAKDRAIESLMQVGDEFVLNVLEEGKFNHVLKHFLKRFAAGEDRFQGVDWSPAPRSSAPVLSDACAYMELKVVSRMETADHWITYCQALDGNVTKEDSKTAIHRRKMGNYY